MPPPTENARHGAGDPGPLPHLGPIFSAAPLPMDARNDAAPPAKAIDQDAARPTKKPTPAQLKEINGLIKGKRFQQALDKTVEYYGIDTSNVNGKVTYDSKLTDSGGSTSADRKVRFGPDTFAQTDSGPAFTASSIVHEVSHANAIKLHGYPGDKPADKVTQEWFAYEVMAYKAEMTRADELGLAKDRKEDTQRKLDERLDALTRPNRKLVESGQYWDMKSDSER